MINSDPKKQKLVEIYKNLRNAAKFIVIYSVSYKLTLRVTSTVTEHEYHSPSK